MASEWQTRLCRSGRPACSINRGRRAGLALHTASRLCHRVAGQDEAIAGVVNLRRLVNQRYMLYFDVHDGRHVRTFVEFESGLNSYRFGGPRPIDEKKLD